MEHKTFELKPMKIGDVLDYSIEIFKANFKTLAVMTVMLYVPWIFIYSFITSKLLGDQITQYIEIITGAMTDTSELEEFTNNSFMYSAISNLVSLLELCYRLTIKLVLNAAVIKVVYDYVLGKKSEINSFKDILKTIRESFGYMPRMMGNAVLFGLIVYAAYIGSAIVGAIIILVPSVLLLTAVPNTATIVFIIVLASLVVLGILFCVGLFWVKLIFGANAIILEKKSVADSLKRSWQLSNGHFWHIGSVSIFGLVLIFIIGNMLSAVSLFAMMISQNLFVLLYTVTQILSSILHPFELIFITVLFINMKIRKEGLDLEVKVNKLFSEQSQKLGNVSGDDNDEHKL